jgi:hypothetical protein
LPDALRAQLFQSVAMTELLSEGWCEPPEPVALHLSTLTEQLLSLIAQHGGATPAQAYAALCSGSSPFQAVTKAMFDDLLRELGSRDVLIQSTDGTLLPGTRGDQTIDHAGGRRRSTSGTRSSSWTGPVAAARRRSPAARWGAHRPLRLVQPQPRRAGPAVAWAGEH